MNKVAVPVNRRVGNMQGDARLYRLNEPLKGNSYVVVSAIAGPWAHETYIFGADHLGEITNWAELPGSFQGGMDHEEALRGAGYEVVEGGD